MKKKELKLMSKEDLKIKLDELKKELMKFNTQIATGTTPKSPGQIKNQKKNIARISTILKTKGGNKKKKKG